jgi:AraC-like DNA-binding protein
VSARPVVRLARATVAINEAFDAVFRPGVGRSEAIQSLRVEELLIWLAEAGAWLGPDIPANLTSRLRKLVVDRPQSDWSADDAARALGMSAATLRRRLAAEGTGFAAILTDVRMTSGAWVVADDGLAGWQDSSRCRLRVAIAICCSVQAPVWDRSA